MRPISAAALLLTSVALLACGGTLADRAPAFGAVGYQTYQGGSTRLVFKTEDKVVMTWRNMSGGPVEGTYTHGGDLIEIVWAPADNSNQATSKLRQIGDCSLAEFWWVGTDGEVHDDDSTLYERTKPACPR